MSVTKPQDRRRLAYLVLSGITILGGLFWLSRNLTSSRPVKDPAYYTGPFMNHNGDLVSPDGKIIEKGNLPRRKAGPALD